MTATGAVTAPDRPTRTARADRRRLRDWMRARPGLVVLLLVPPVVLGSALLVGTVFADGDNLLQNFPLRTLVGRDLAHGVLPLWNPYLFGGMPLLGGFNAGASYPTTWLTAVLPQPNAWTLNLALAYDLAVAGTYAFLRREGVGSTAATFGAGTFAFAGYLSAQIVHLDLVEGAAWLPWTLLAVHGLTAEGRGGRSGRRAVRGWLALLALSVGMALLTGGVEAIIDSAVLVGIYVVGRLVLERKLPRTVRRPPAATVGLLAAGVAGGLALGAAQWLPGLAFQSQSQRASASYAFFSTGSLPARLLTLGATPFVLGTNQDRPAYYAGPYNFPEVTSYVGILALVAACALFARRRRRAPEARRWWVWYAVLAVGLLSALGAQTPFGRVLFELPLVQSERLLNRNLLLVDFALAVLLAWWAHLLLDRAETPPDPAVTVRARWRPGERAEVLLTCLPLAFVTVVTVAAWADAPELERLLGAQFAIDTRTRVVLAAIVTGFALVAAVATWVALVDARFGRRRLRRLLAGVLVVDLVGFNALVLRPPVTQSHAQAQGSAATRFTALVGDGRFIVYDPDQFHADELQALGQTDLNTFNRLPSAQGYTALTDARYYAATGAHYQEDLDAATLAGTVWDELNVTTLLTLPSYFVSPVGTPPSGPGSIPFAAAPQLYNGSPTANTGPAAIDPAADHRWYFGGPLTVRSWSFRLFEGSVGTIRVGLLDEGGAVHWLAAPSSEATAVAPVVHVDLPDPVRATGVVVANNGAGTAVIGVPTAVTVGTGTLALDGPLQYGVVSPHWAYAGTFGSFGVFHNASARGWAWTVPKDGGAGGATTVAASAPDQGGGQAITVQSGGAVDLVRSETYGTGWHATVESLTARTGGTAGGSTTAPVLAAGLLQSVALPGPGRYRVTFTYEPLPATVGIVLSAVAALALVAGAAVEGVAAERRRRARLRSG